MTIGPARAAAFGRPSVPWPMLHHRPIMTPPPRSRTAWAPGQRLLTAGLVFLVTAIGFEGLAVPTALPATLTELRGLAWYGWAFSAFFLANLVGIALAGAESDRRGPILPFVLGAIGFATGLLVSGLAPAMAWVVLGRAIQGLGAGAIGAVIYLAIARGYEPRSQARMIAVVSSAWVLPGLAGPALAGWISQELSWRWIFLGLAPLLGLAAVVVAVPLARLSVQATTARPPARPVADALLLAVGAGALLAALSMRSLLFSPPVALVGGLLALGPARRLLAGGASDLGRAGAAIGVLALASVAFFGVEAFLPLAVASVRNQGTLAGGLALTAAALTWATGSWLHARLATRRSRRDVTVAGLLLVAAGILLATGVPVTSVPAVALAAGAWAVAGLGMGLAYSTATLAAIEAAPAGREGAVSASLQLAVTLGVALGTGTGGGVLAFTGAGFLGVAAGMVIVNLLMLVVCGVALHVARGMPAVVREPGPPALVAATDHGPAL